MIWYLYGDKSIYALQTFSKTHNYGQAHPINLPEVTQFSERVATVVRHFFSNGLIKSL